MTPGSRAADVRRMRCGRGADVHETLRSGRQTMQRRADYAASVVSHMQRADAVVLTRMWWL